jgi:hypothetical protein
MLHMLPARIRIYLTSILRYKFLILDAYHPDTLYLLERGCEDPWLFYDAKRGSREKRLGNTDLCAPTFTFTNYRSVLRGYIFTATS